MLSKGVHVNKSLLQAIVSTLEDTQLIRNTMSGINAQDSPPDVRLLLRRVLRHCTTIDSILEEALARSCRTFAGMLPVEEEEANDRDIVLSGVVR